MQEADLDAIYHGLRLRSSELPIHLSPAMRCADEPR
jgi:hypothetical protein